MSIYLTAIIKSTVGNSALLKAYLLELVQHSTRENACLLYDLQQSSEDENLFIFHEEWASQGDLDFHNEQPYIKAFGEKSVSILDGGVVIYKTQKIG